MSENNTIQEQNTAVQTPAEEPKKRLRVGFVFLAIVPMAVLMMVQTVSQLPFLVLAVVEAMNKAETQGPDFDMYSEMLNVFNDKYAIFAYLIYAVIGLVIFSIWYYKGFVKKGPKVKIGEVVSVKSVVGTICIVVGLYFFTNAFMTLADKLIPQAMEEYAMMIESAGLVTNPAITVIYAIILGPILEELCFRGVTYGLFEKAGLRPGLVILFSSLLFGAIHLILIQVLYAAFLGLFLGFLRYKYRSIKITIVAHILFNFTGTYISSLIQDLFDPSDAVMLIIGGISMFVLVAAIVLINSDKKAFKPAK
jgi:membrane protease YdiL (CAAX protease family)